MRAPAWPRALRTAPKPRNKGNTDARALVEMQNVAPQKTLEDGQEDQRQTEGLPASHAPGAGPRERTCKVSERSEGKHRTAAENGPRPEQTFPQRGGAAGSEPLSLLLTSHRAAPGHEADRRRLTCQRGYHKRRQEATRRPGGQETALPRAPVPDGAAAVEEGPGSSGNRTHSPPAPAGALRNTCPRERRPACTQHPGTVHSSCVPATGCRGTLHWSAHPAQEHRHGPRCTQKRAGPRGRLLRNKSQFLKVIIA